MSGPVQFEIRSVGEADWDALAELSRFLDTVNLPDDRAELLRIARASEASFSGATSDPRRRQYVFLLRDLQTGEAVGTSMVFGQLGRRDAPYIYFDVRTEERYSATLDRHFLHDVLTIGYSFDGPTEIGGLVMHPERRRSDARLGMLISYCRFLWIAMHRKAFQDEVLAELLPPLEPDGTSHLWEAVGRHFTGLSYREADRLSKRNKEFIRGLFPAGEIYASLLPRDAREVIGKVGPQTRGVEKLLRRIGFRYIDRVDPFDGGPHFVAPTDEITLVARSARRVVRVGESQPGARALVAVEGKERPWFRAVAARVALPEASDHGDAPAVVVIDGAVAGHLGVDDGAEVWTLPLD
jgi:arginine N-succinyltransferase